TDRARNQGSLSLGRVPSGELVSEAILTILSGLTDLRGRFAARLDESLDEPSLRAARAEFLGKKGELTALLRGMGKVPADSRKEVGEKVNTAREELEELFNARLHSLKE